MKFRILKALPVLLAAVVAVSSINSYADDDGDNTPPPPKKHRKKGALAQADGNVSGQGYGMAGCGLGSILFGEQQGMTQIFASTTNGTFGTQTFGISSGTSNCTDGGTVAMQKAVPTYIEANRESLSTDIARGQGETLAGLSSVMGCNDSAELAVSLRRHYKSIFPSDSVSSSDVTSAIMGVVKHDSQLRCYRAI